MHLRRMLSKPKPWVGTLLSVVLTFQSVLPSSAGTADARELVGSSDRNNPDLLDYYPPNDLARVTDSFVALPTSQQANEPTSQRLVLLIQDLHAHPGVQHKISKLLEHYAGRGIAQDSVFVEGAEGPIDTTLMALFPDEKIKLQVTDEYVAKGLFTGMEDYAIRNRKTHYLYGVEDGPAYQLHKEFFRKSFEGRNELAQRIVLLEQRLKTLEPQVLNRGQKKLKSKHDAYQTGKLSLAKYLNYLEKGSNELPAELQAMRSLLQTESKLPKSERLKEETKAFLTLLHSQLTQEETDKLSEYAKSNSSVYYLYLFQLANRHNALPAAPRALRDYLVYNQKKEHQDLPLFQRKVEEVEHNILLSQASTQTQKNLIQAQQDLKQLQDLLELKLTEDQLRDLQPRTDQLLVVLNSLLSYEPTSYRTNEQTVLKELISQALDFYTLALLRDRPLVEKTLAQQNRNVSVLVTGGFHTQGIARILKQKSISYITLSPNVDSYSDSDQKRYLDLLLGKAQATLHPGIAPATGNTAALSATRALVRDLSDHEPLPQAVTDTNLELQKAYAAPVPITVTLNPEGTQLTIDLATTPGADLSLSVDDLQRPTESPTEVKSFNPDTGSWRVAGEIGLKILAILLASALGADLVSDGIHHFTTTGTLASAAALPKIPNLPWLSGAGKMGGVEDFPKDKELREKLQHAEHFTDRVLVLIDHIGISKDEFFLSVKRSRRLRDMWKFKGVEIPESSTIKAICDVLDVNPFFMLTGLPQERAFRLGTIGDRIKLAMQGAGVTNEVVFQQTGLSRQVVTKCLTGQIPDRDNLFILAKFLGFPPVQLETGFLPPELKLFSRSSDKRNSFKNTLSDYEKHTAQDLEKALLEKWEEQGLPVAAWKPMVAPDPQHLYPGLAGRLISALPDTLKAGVHYGLISQNAADWLKALPRPKEGKKWSVAFVEEHKAWLAHGENSGFITELAEGLAKAYLEFEEMFELERIACPGGSIWRPPQGYINQATIRIENPWDLIARFQNRARLLVIVNQTPFPRNRVKEKICSDSFPEDALIERANSIETLEKKFPFLTSGFILGVVLRSPKLAEKLLEQANRLHSILGRGWILRVSDLIAIKGGNNVRFLEIVTSRSGILSQTIEAFQRRDLAVMDSLGKHPRKDEIKDHAHDLMGLLDPKPPEEPGTQDDWVARDLLNRLIAWRQLEDKAFLASDVPVDTADLEPFLTHVASELNRRKHAPDQWPQTPAALQALIQDISRSFPPVIAPDQMVDLKVASRRSHRKSSKTGPIILGLAIASLLLPYLIFLMTTGVQASPLLTTNALPNPETLWSMALLSAGSPGRQKPVIHDRVKEIFRGFFNERDPSQRLTLLADELEKLDAPQRVQFFHCLVWLDDRVEIQMMTEAVFSGSNPVGNRVRDQLFQAVTDDESGESMFVIIDLFSSMDQAQLENLRNCTAVLHEPRWNRIAQGASAMMVLGGFESRIRRLESELERQDRENEGKLEREKKYDPELFHRIQKLLEQKVEIYRRFTDSFGSMPELEKLCSAINGIAVAGIVHSGKSSRPEMEKIFPRQLWSEHINVAPLFVKRCHAARGAIRAVANRSPDIVASQLLRLGIRLERSLQTYRLLGLEDPEALEHLTYSNEFNQELNDLKTTWLRAMSLSEPGGSSSDPELPGNSRFPFTISLLLGIGSSAFMTVQILLLIAGVHSVNGLGGIDRLVAMAVPAHGMVGSDRLIESKRYQKPRPILDRFLYAGVFGVLTAAIIRGDEASLKFQVTYALVAFTLSTVYWFLAFTVYSFLMRFIVQSYYKGRWVVDQKPERPSPKAITHRQWMRSFLNFFQMLSCDPLVETVGKWGWSLIGWFGGHMARAVAISHTQQFGSLRFLRAGPLQICAPDGKVSVYPKVLELHVEDKGQTREETQKDFEQFMGQVGNFEQQGYSAVVGKTSNPVLIRYASRLGFKIIRPQNENSGIHASLRRLKDDLSILVNGLMKSSGLYQHLRSSRPTVLFLPFKNAEKNPPASPASSSPASSGFSRMLFVLAIFGLTAFLTWPLLVSLLTAADQAPSLFTMDALPNPEALWSMIMPDGVERVTSSHRNQQGEIRFLEHDDFRQIKGSIREAKHIAIFDPYSHEGNIWGISMMKLAPLIQGLRLANPSASLTIYGADDHVARYVPEDGHYRDFRQFGSDVAPGTLVFSLAGDLFMRTFDVLQGKGCTVVKADALNYLAPWRRMSFRRDLVQMIGAMVGGLKRPSVEQTIRGNLAKWGLNPPHPLLMRKSFEVGLVFVNPHGVSNHNYSSQWVEQWAEFMKSLSQTGYRVQINKGVGDDAHSLTAKILAALGSHAPVPEVLEFADRGAVLDYLASKPQAVVTIDSAIFHASHRLYGIPTLVIAPEGEYWVEVPRNKEFVRVGFDKFQQNPRQISKLLPALLASETKKAIGSSQGLSLAVKRVIMAVAQLSFILLTAFLVYQQLTGIHSPEALWSMAAGGSAGPGNRGESGDLVESEAVPIEKIVGLPWESGAGKENGVEDFPEEKGLRENLRRADRFTERALVLVDHMGIKRTDFLNRIGKSADLDKVWESREVDPRVATIKAVCEALDVNPVFMVTGLREEQAFRSGNIGDRMRLAMQRAGVSIESVYENTGVTAGQISNYCRGDLPNRDTIFTLAKFLGCSPAQLESGYLPPNHSLFSHSGHDKRAFKGNPSVYEKRLAKNLEKALFHEWEKQGQPIAAWKPMIIADERHAYPGLTGRLIVALPDTLEAGFHYGLISREVADWLKGIPRPKSGRGWTENFTGEHDVWLAHGVTTGLVKKLALELAKAYLDLEEMFRLEETAYPNDSLWRPPDSYTNNEQTRLENSWDLIARILNRGRILAIVDRLPFPRAELKRTITSVGFPEEILSKRADVIEQLKRQFPVISPAFIIKVVLSFSDQAPKILEKANSVFQWIGRNWILRVSHFVVIRGVDNMTLLHRLTRSPQILFQVLETLERRDGAVMESLAHHTRADEIRNHAQNLKTLLNPKPSDVPGTEEDWAARDLLNRLIALRQLEDSRFLPKDVPVDMGDLKEFITHVAQELDRRSKDLESWPQTPGALEAFLQDISRSFPPAITPDQMVTLKAATSLAEKQKLSQSNRLNPGLTEAATALAALGLIAVLVYQQLSGIHSHEALWSMAVLLPGTKRQRWNKPTKSALLLSVITGLSASLASGAPSPKGPGDALLPPVPQIQSQLLSGMPSAQGIVNRLATARAS